MNYVELIHDDKWFKMLLKSIKNRTVDGIEFPGFPNESVQSQFVGSSNEAALREGFEFFTLVKGYSAALGMPLNKTSKVLDFGCGWGRFLRIFKKDIAEENLFGVDIDPSILDECRKNQVPGELSRIFPNGKLPYPDNFFDCIMAYSVFTHLPENIHKHWINEIARVAKPGCVFVLTLESIRFLDFVENLDSNNPISGWHAGLSQFSSEIPAHRKAYNDGDFVYLPTGGGDFRAADVYGDAVVPLKYVEQEWSKHFNIIEYIDNQDRFWQAVLVTQRT
jgi:SAM-dependent methyltransferase